MKISNYENVCLNCRKRFYAASKKPLCPKCRETHQQLKETAKGHTLKDIGLPYRFELFTLSRETINRFVFLSNRRRLSNANLNSLVRTLKSGKHFDSPIVVSKEEGLYHVIDGNHRVEAFKTILSRVPNFKLEILLITYNRLDDDEKISVFRRWNVGRPQSTDDFIQSVAHNIDIIRWIKKDFPIPVSIYRKVDTIHIRTLLSGYLAAKKEDRTFGSYNRSNFTDAIKTFDREDYDFVYEFSRRFKDVFGIPSRINPYYKTTFVQAAAYLAYEYSNAPLLFTAMAERVRGDQEIVDFAKMGGREATKQMIQKLKDRVKTKPKLKVR